MEILNKRLNLREFKEYVKDFDFGRFIANKLVIHHTWRPTKSQWQGKESIEGLAAYYERKGWNSGPHLFIADDGIWLFTPMNVKGTHAGVANWRSIGIEVVGDYDRKKWASDTKENALGAIKILMDKLDINTEMVKFHRDDTNKSCPGYSITKEWLFNELNYYNEKDDIPKWGKDAWKWADEEKLLSDESEFNAPTTDGKVMVFLNRYHKGP